MVSFKELIAKIGLLGNPNIPEMAKKQDIEGIVFALKYTKNEDVIKRAEVALLEMGEKTLPILINQLKTSDDEKFKTAICKLIGKLGVPSIEKAIELLSDATFANLGVKIAEVIGDPIVEPLLKIVNDFYANSRLRVALIPVLGSIGEHSSNPEIRKKITYALACQAVYFDNMTTSRPPTFPGSFGNSFALEKPCYKAIAQVGDVSGLLLMSILTFDSTFHQGNPRNTWYAIMGKLDQKAVRPLLELLLENPITDFGHYPLLELSDNSEILEIVRNTLPYTEEAGIKDFALSVMLEILSYKKLTRGYKTEAIQCLKDLTGKEYETKEEWLEHADELAVISN